MVDSMLMQKMKLMELEENDEKTKNRICMAKINELIECVIVFDL